MKVAFLTPLPPVRSGIAQYSAMLLPALSGRLDVTAVVQQSLVDPRVGATIDYSRFVDIKGSYDAVICQLGNNLHHEFIFDFARQNRSIVVLHDLVLHHLIAEKTLARGNESAYIDELRRSEGALGEAYARGRAAGFHLELANFLLPAVREVAEESLHVIVHNDFA
ncbi:MAG TPA: hypothetical protein VHL58_14430, partial [Thermoanaerobaculia bacterium]|nr:hypothetical protein [Thermoanaerobaculia bacterium]